MKATAVSLLALFDTKIQLEVPLFQRQYVWQRENHWEPLWEDISRKFAEYLDGRNDTPIHFLGAMVLDQKQTPATHVGKRQVIDGQQRLTTFQIFLAAFRDFCNECDCKDLAEEFETFTLNKGMMAHPEIDKFKVWPTQLDRVYFADVILSGSQAKILEKYPEKRKPRTRNLEPRPRIIEAYLFFYEQLNDFLLGTKIEEPLAAATPIPERIVECFQALKNSLQVVEIDLEQGDDAQVIFETLNARGEPLLPADLLRNFIFLRAARRGEPQEALYEEFWARFDEQFWRDEVKQGRLSRPRSDLFLQHFLASRLKTDIPIKHLFIEYKFWIDREQPFPSVKEELVCLARQREDFRRIIAPIEGDILLGLAQFLDAFDIRTSYPLLLMMLDVGLSKKQWGAVSKTLESYLLRRAVCGLTTKNYNRIFLSLTKNLHHDGVTPENLVKYLSQQTGDSSEWPSDRKFGEAWRTEPIYQTLNNPKIVHIFKSINKSYVTSKMENISVDSKLSVEHILPQQWQENWLLSNTLEEKQRAEAIEKRNSVLQTLGNLTILTHELNSSLSNSQWIVKKPELLKHSLLPINQQLQDVNIWDECTISKRADELFVHALKIWPK